MEPAVAAAAAEEARKPVCSSVFACVCEWGLNGEECSTAHLPGAITTTAQKRPISWSESRSELSRSAKSNIESRRKRALEAECRASRRRTSPFRQTIDAEGESNMQARRTSSTSKTPAWRKNDSKSQAVVILNPVYNVPLEV